MIRQYVFDTIQVQLVACTVEVRLNQLILLCLSGFARSEGRLLLSAHLVCQGCCDKSSPC